LQQLGVTIASVDWSSAFEVAAACSGAACVVSALQGLRDVIVETQSVLLDAAIKAGVPRFIPSDYSIDFTKFPPGENRNLDLRRDFHKRLDKTSISATTIFNGAFADMLTGQMPLILFKLKRVLYWGDADQRMDFTTMDDTATFTACAALDPSTPRFLRIAGDQLSARELTAVASEVTGKKFRLFRAGGLGMLGALIKVAARSLPERRNFTRHGRACSTCVTCSTAGQSSNPSTTIAIQAFVGRLRGMCSQHFEAGTPKGTENPS
jgi:hypothetical protein